jgi:hypothetical protein
MPLEPLAEPTLCPNHHCVRWPSSFSSSSSSSSSPSVHCMNS